MYEVRKLGKNGYTPKNIPKTSISNIDEAHMMAWKMYLLSNKYGSFSGINVNFRGGGEVY